MHELSVTENIIAIAERHARAAQATRIVSIRLVIGELSSIVDDSIQFYFDHLAANTLAAGATLAAPSIAQTANIEKGATLRVLRPTKFVDPDQTIEVDSVVGAYMQVRGAAIHQAGLLDETFFMYGEDLDWAYRIKQRGWQVWYNAAVTVLHVKEAASKTSSKARYEFYRAMLIFYRKHYQATTPLLLHWAIVGGIGLRGAVDVAGRRWSQWLNSLRPASSA